ncbi:MAG: hypothetical protein AAFX76_03405 [Planctomycetota bacterium]
MSPSSYDLTREIREAQGTARVGQGDGWTLEQHITEHGRLPTAVTFRDDPKILIATHRTPGRTKFWVGLGVLLAAVVGAFVAGLVPGFADWGVPHIAGAVVAGCMTVVLTYQALAHTKMGLNKVGLIARPWPPVPGIGVAVPLRKIRRFKVNKKTRDGQVVYELMLLTRDQEEHRIIPQILLKRDAYLLAMLLIDRVKRQRGGA